MLAPDAHALIAKGGLLIPPVVRLVGTFTVLTACLFVILSGGYDPNSKNWAFGTVGTILGYWLKSSR
jgi:hypothetical protein